MATSVGICSVTGEVTGGSVGETTGAQVLTRFNDPMGLPRGPTDTTTGGASFTAATGVQAALFPADNSANSTGFGASNGYLGDLNDAGSGLTHEGARDLDQTTGTFTAPDPILDPATPAITPRTPTPKAIRSTAPTRPA